MIDEDFDFVWYEKEVVASRSKLSVRLCMGIMDDKSSAREV